MKRRAPVVAALLLFALPAAASAQSVERGSPLQRQPYPGPPADGSDCDAQPNPSFDSSPYQFVNNGSPSCSWYQVGVSGPNFNSDPRSGFAGATGRITRVQVRTGSNPAPLRFFIGRQITPAQNGNPAGNPECCFFITEQGPFQPAPNAVSTFPVNLPVENSREPTIITNDFIGFSANSNTGTLPLARVPGQDNNFSFGQTGTLNAGGYWPAFGQLANDTGGGRRSGGYGGIEVLLRYTLTGGTGTSIGPPIMFSAQDITQLGGQVLRPIGRDLDVIIRCLQVTCNGTLNVVTRNRVGPAAKGKKKIRSLGKKKFKVKKGKRRVRIKLNKLGRKMARRKRTKVKVVVSFGSAGMVTKNLTMRRARKRKR